MLPLILDPTAGNVFRINTLRASCRWLCLKTEKELPFYYANKFTNVFYDNLRFPLSIIHIYRLRIRMIFRTLSFCL